MDLVDLAPGDRRGDLRAWPGADRPCAEDGLVRGVLVVIDEHSRAAFFLPPRRRDEVGPASLQVARYRHGGRPDLVGIPARLQANVDVQATVARRLGVSGDPDLSQEYLQFTSGLPDVGEVHARRRIKVNPKLVGVG